MIAILNKRTIIRLVLITWVAIWVGLLIAEDKDGQYRTFAYLYSHGPAEKARYIAGERLSDLVAFCRANIPEGSTYRMKEFGNLSMNEVRARYELWPLKCVKDDPDYIIVYEDKGEPVGGYGEFRRFDGQGLILKKEGR